MAAGMPDLVTVKLKVRRYPAEMLHGHIPHRLGEGLNYVLFRHHADQRQQSLRAATRRTVHAGLIDVDELSQCLALQPYFVDLPAWRSGRWGDKRVLEVTADPAGRKAGGSRKPP